jgi:hypothetical protein
MSQQSILSAQARWNTFLSQTSGMKVTNFKIIPGYGTSWTQDGVNRSARLPEVEQSDADFINELTRLATGTSANPAVNLTVDPSLPFSGSWPWWIWALLILIIWFLWKKFFKKKRR